MKEEEPRKKPQRAGPAPVLGAILLILVCLTAYCQTAHRTWTTRHDSYRLLPVQEWGIAIGPDAGYWDGINMATHRGVGGRIEDYGIIERMTNTQ